MHTGKTKIIITGAGGSGKDYLRKGLEKMGLKYGVPFTTRRPRAGEVLGKDYYFVDLELFQDLKEKGVFLYTQKFRRDCFYGLSKKDFKECNLFIMTPKIINNLIKKNKLNRDDAFLIYLNIPEQTRKERLINRKRFQSCSDSVELRLQKDREDFKNFSLFDLEITDSFFDIDSVFKQIENLVQRSKTKKQALWESD